MSYKCPYKSCGAAHSRQWHSTRYGWICDGCVKKVRAEPVPTLQASMHPIHPDNGEYRPISRKMAGRY